MGAFDDVISVSGHRLGTMENQSALVDYPVLQKPLLLLSGIHQGRRLSPL